MTLIKKCEEIVKEIEKLTPAIKIIMDATIPRMEGKDEYVFVESGVFIGNSSKYFLARMILAGKKVVLHAIDNFDFANTQNQAAALGIKNNKQYYIDVLKECEMLDLVVIHHIDAKQGPELFENGSIDFILIDDLHEPNHLAWEVKQYAPKIAVNGVMTIDDMNAINLRKAVFETLGKENVEIVNNCVAIIKKEDIKLGE